MKLEGIDPEHPSRYCVLTVFEVVGKFAVVYKLESLEVLKLIDPQATESVYTLMDIRRISTSGSMPTRWTYFPLGGLRRMATVSTRQKVTYRIISTGMPT